MKALLKIISKLPNKLVLLLDQAIVSGSSFVLNVVLVWILGLETYGVFAILWMILMGVVAIQQSMFTLPMLSFAPKLQNNKQNNYLKQVLAAQQIILIPSIALVTMIVWWVKAYLSIENITLNLLLVWAAWVYLYSNFDFLRKLNFVKGKQTKNLITDCCVFFIQLFGLLVVYLMFPFSLGTVLSVLVLSYFLVVFIPLTKSALNINLRSVSQIVNKHLHFSKWLIGKNVLQWFTANYFIIYTGALLGPAVVGAIRLIQNILGLLHVVFLAMENQLPIQAATIYTQEGFAKMNQYLVKSSLQYGLIIIPLIALIAIFPTQILNTIYGQNLTEYAALASMFSLSYIVVFIGYPFRFSLRTIENTQALFTAYVVGTVLSYLLAHPLIQIFGMYGVVMGLLTVQVASILVYVAYLFPKFIKNENYSYRLR